MNFDFAAAMRQAAQLTRQRNLMEATRVIQRALSGRGRAAPPADPSPESARLIAPPNASEAPAAAEPPRARRAWRAPPGERAGGRTPAGRA